MKIRGGDHTSHLLHRLGSSYTWIIDLTCSGQDTLAQRRVQPEHAAAMPDRGVVIGFHRVVVATLRLEIGDRVGLSSLKERETVIPKRLGGGENLGPDPPDDLAADLVFPGRLAHLG